MGLGPEARVELEDVVEVVEEVLDAVDVGDDDQLGEADEQVGPAGGVVVKQVEQVAAALRGEATATSETASAGTTLNKATTRGQGICPA